MILYLLIVLLSCLVARIYFNYKKVKDAIDKIPGPPAHPILGNILMFNHTEEEVWKILRSVNKTYYPISKYWLGPFPIVSFHHPNDFQTLLSSSIPFQKGNGYKAFYPWLKTGLLTSSGTKWQHRRKILTPAFHINLLRKYLEIANQHGKNLIETLHFENKETILSLVPFCSNRTLHVICESAMGIALDDIDSKVAKKYEKSLSEMGLLIMYRIMRPYIKDWMLIAWWKVGRKHQNALKCLHDFTEKVLFERKNYHKCTNNKYLKDYKNELIDAEDNTSFGSKKKLAFLDLLLSAEQDGLIDNEGIKEELDTFMFAGHDTTAMGLVYAIMLLAENKAIQEKARVEVTRVLDKSKGDIKAPEIQEFHYLERCIKESLRLFPPAWALARVLKEDIKLGNYVIPAGTEIGGHIFDLHRDPNFWPEPMKYDPDRFLPEKVQEYHPYSYIPFSAGPRNCIGQKFALMELKCLIAHILYNFELEPVTLTSDIQFTFDLLLRPSKPVYTKFIKINRFVH